MWLASLLCNDDLAVGEKPLFCSYFTLQSYALSHPISHANTKFALFFASRNILSLYDSI